MKNGLSKSVFRAQKGCFRDTKRPISGGFRVQIGPFRVSLGGMLCIGLRLAVGL